MLRSRALSQGHGGARIPSAQDHYLTSSNANQGPGGATLPSAATLVVGPGCSAHLGPCRGEAPRRWLRDRGYAGLVRQTLSDPAVAVRRVAPIKGPRVVKVPGRGRPKWLVYLIAVVVTGIGISLLYVAGRNDWIWEWVGKSIFLDDVMGTSATAAGVRASDLTAIGVNYQADVPWEDLFKTVRKLDIFVAYGRTWRNSHLQELEAVSQRPDARIRVFLPDPDDEATIAVLSERFSTKPADLSAAITEARTAYEVLSAGRATVEVYYRKGDHVFSAYRFDGVAAVTLYTHGQARTGVPVFVCREGGSLNRFVRAEFDAIKGQSSLVSEGNP
jgi:hypothetical protein